MVQFMVASAQSKTCMSNAFTDNCHTVALWMVTAVEATEMFASALCKNSLFAFGAATVAFVHIVHVNTHVAVCLYHRATSLSCEQSVKENRIRKERKMEHMQAPLHGEFLLFQCLRRAPLRGPCAGLGPVLAPRRCCASAAHPLRIPSASVSQPFRVSFVNLSF